MKCLLHNTMGDKLLLNFGAKFLALIYNFTCEITTLLCQHSICASANMALKFLNAMNGDVRAFKDVLPGNALIE